MQCSGRHAWQAAHQPCHEQHLSQHQDVLLICCRGVGRSQYPPCRSAGEVSLLHATSHRMPLSHWSWGGDGLGKASPGVIAVQASARSRAFTTELSFSVALDVGTG